MPRPVDADHAAGVLLRELAHGRAPHPVLRALLIDALQEGPPARLGAARKSWREARTEAGASELEALDNARASAAWMTATTAERGAALDDLLGLADALPSERTHRMRRRRFPRLDRSP
jgi:hypothetical protein